ncbi:3-keto-disaccharide hydrolase [Engelhardtia mirabilis]|uniref:3-keto-alpha-glucoside-1,2-lyase/3-keto-2-hydroxy-glucal hydratase domain-containing protein n=1 Tax=Engelhardtia mirabilis TaxID=2528011 RepID=A0A518BQ99_9BACT|nr:hypothetical protein Pla133_42680 [Planctomycetes bacterium Pla133]QDV03479.1 hypothetical protein Pla86_42670 [Planctomycetes bacterium Pla86]
MKLSLLLLAGAGATLFAARPTVQDHHPVGYDDTPFLPGGEWRVHDSARPVPPVVEPGAGPFTPPPADATVLFDGSSTAAWHQGGEAIQWKVEGGAMQVSGGGDIRTRADFGDVQLHIEWASPSEPVSESQGRGNSGVFFMDRYEVQVLDSFENRTYADGQAAAMYGQYPPLVNVCRAPGEWQAYDIVFEAPRFDGDKLLHPARLTMFHNGVLVHNAREFLGATAHRSVATYSPHAPKGPIKLQDHGNPVRFRNVWVREL